MSEKSRDDRDYYDLKQIVNEEMITKTFLERDKYYEFFCIVLQKDFEDEEVERISYDQKDIIYHPVIPRTMYTTNKIIAQFYSRLNCDVHKLIEICYSTDGDLSVRNFCMTENVVLKSRVRMRDIFKGLSDVIRFGKDDQQVQDFLIDSKFLDNTKAITISIASKDNSGILKSVISFPKTSVFGLAEYVDKKTGNSLTRIILKAKIQGDRDYWDRRKDEIIYNMNKKISNGEKSK